MEQEIKKSFKNKRIGSWVAVLLLIIVIVVIASLGGFNDYQSASPAVLTTIPVTPTVVDPCSAFQQSQAKTIGFNELNKDPDSFNGTASKFTGQIVEIHESNGTGVIRLAVTKTDYGWSPSNIIYINYMGHNKFVQDDVVTVYGVLQGSYTYTSQANYQITLPSMEGCLLK